MLLHKSYPITNNDYQKVKSKWGVYLFILKPTNEIDEDTLKDLWDETPNGYINYPKLCNSRFKESIQNKRDNYPFYVGKSEKVGKRIEEHITQDKHKTTYGLKLKDRRILKEHSVSYSFWLLPEKIQKIEHKPIKQFLITYIEHQLRLKLLPWIGKQ